MGEVYSVKGTSFLLDSFPRDVDKKFKFFFLSHFHSDHYQGLSRAKISDERRVVCSPITSRLIQDRFRIPRERIIEMDSGEVKELDGIKVAAIPANHCPGALIFTFQTADGHTCIYTGDFRFCKAMETDAHLCEATNPDVLYLDSTFGRSRYQFPPQQATIEYISQVIHDDLKKRSDTLFLVGGYTIGKERILVDVARKCRCQVAVSEGKMKLLEKLDPEIDVSTFTTDEESTPIHFVSFDLKKHAEHILSGTKYSRIFAFSATGWNGNKCSGFWLDTERKIKVFKVPYSEHSNYKELRAMVKLLRPRKIVFTAMPPGAKVERMKEDFTELMDNSRNRSTLIPWLMKAKGSMGGDGKNICL